MSGRSAKARPEKGADNALLFWEALSDDSAERLDHLSFAVLVRVWG